MRREELNERIATSGNYIRAWRQHRGFTQTELANLIGVDRTYLARLELGGRRYVQEVLEKLAKVLVCKPPDLVGRHPGISTELETLYLSLTEEERARALGVLRAMFPR
jgi:transcriptional regulator with XRE-family HTH domain